jgi:hypothetical protein
MPVTAIIEARSLADGTTVRLVGTLTTDLGAIDSARIGFIQDATDGIAIRLDAALSVPIQAGTSVAVEGTLGSYFSLRVVNVAASAVELIGPGTLPEPMGSTTGGVSELLEGIRLSVEGNVTESPNALSDGLGVTIDDGSGPLRLVVGSLAQSGQPVATGDRVIAVGPLGQRDSSGTGLAGYRLHATLPGELVVIATPTPSPTVSPTPTPTPSPTPTDTPGPTPTDTPGTPSATPVASATAVPTPAPTATPTPSTAATIPIVTARSAAVGTRVTVGGVVTAGAGRLGTPALIAIQDSTAAIVVRLADTTPRPSIGTWLELTGTLGDPYGQLELRAITGVRDVGPATLPAPVTVDGATLGEGVEARLVSLEGVAQGRPIKSTSGDLAFVVMTAHGQVRIVADASAGLSTSAVATGERLRLTGIAGQRASRKDALDGYRVWLRGLADIVRLGGSQPSTTASPSPSPSSAPTGATIRTIAAAILASSGTLTIEGSVTTAASLLDATKRRVIVQDRTAAIEVLVPAGTSAPPVGARIRVSGEVGRAYGAPRIRAATIRRLGTAVVSPLELRVAPVAAHEWRLIRVRGDLLEVHRSGDRWTAELLVGGTRVPIVGLAGAGIPVAAIAAGRTATVTGIVRRPYPSASDRRFAVVPRSPGDLIVGGAVDDSAASGSVSHGSSGIDANALSGSLAGSGSATTAGDPLDVDLVALAGHVGETVRVGGLVETVTGDGFRLDDGTAVAFVRLRATAVDIAGSIVVGDALSATGRVEVDSSVGAPIMVVDDPAGIVLVGDLGAGDPTGTEPDPTAMSGSTAGGPTGSGSGTAATVTAGLADPGLPEIGALGIVLVSLASLAVTLLRRQRMRRRLAGRIADRLAAIVAGPGSAQSAVATASAGRPAASPATAGPGLANALARPEPPTRTGRHDDQRTEA